MKARVSNLYKTEADWMKLAFTPADGELVIYAPDKNYTYARLKVGDGHTPLNLLPFFTDACVDAKLAEHTHAEISDAGRINDYFI